MRFILQLPLRLIFWPLQLLGVVLHRRPAGPALELAAWRWRLAGRADERLPHSWSYYCLVCWNHTTTVLEPRGATLRAYIAAARAIPENVAAYETILGRRDQCERCGSTYRMENLSTCMHCRASWCPECREHRHRHVNGNRMCTCGGELDG